MFKSTGQSTNNGPKPSDICELGPAKTPFQKVTCFLCSPVGMLTISMVVHPILKPLVGECPSFIHDLWGKFNIKVLKL